MALADRTESAAEQDIRHVDVLIVGAGISGIGAAARLERDRPGTSYAILEARQAIGGTWDLFRFPGVRSDTDIFTYAFPFKPWPHDTSMGDGEHIRAYLRETASEHGIEPHIHFGTKVLGAAWSSDAARWTVRAEREGAPEEWTCSFLLLCTGYYDYEDGFLPHFEGVEDYEGAFVIPQHWPEDLDHRDKRVVVIGSGATTVTLIPALARDAERVTMLQRSPSYIATLPRIDPLATFVRRWLPASLAHRLLRLKNILIWQGLYVFSRRGTAQGRRLFRWLALRHIATPEFVDTHFRPRYEPWDQRVCLAPDGDIFKAIRAGKAS